MSFLLSPTSLHSKERAILFFFSQYHIETKGEHHTQFIYHNKDKLFIKEVENPNIHINPI
jgi:hypothetical protein